MVVVREEVLAEDPGVLEAPEACGERRQYFRVLKFASENGLSHVGSRVAPRHAEVHHQLADRFGAHGPAAIGVDRERAAGDPLGENRVLDELLGELGVLVRRDQPVENIATEDVEDHVEVVEEASVGPWSLVMAQLQISLGCMASNSGRFLAGWGRWARRALEEPLLPSNRCMVAGEQR